MYVDTRLCRESLATLSSDILAIYARAIHIDHRRHIQTSVGSDGATSDQVCIKNWLGLARRGYTHCPRGATCPMTPNESRWAPRGALSDHDHRPKGAESPSSFDYGLASIGFSFVHLSIHQRHAFSFLHNCVIDLNDSL